jgi:hypothetical protein
MPKGNAYKQATLYMNLTEGNTYLALFSTNPNADGSGTELNYSGYTRKQIIWGSAYINGSVSEIKNTNLIEFPTVPSDSGLTSAYAAIMNAATGGSVIYYGALGANYPLIQGVKPTVPIGSLIVTES